MEPINPVTQRLRDVIVRKTGCDLEELALECPEMSWNQVFLAIDRLSRTGEITLSRNGPGRYVVQMTRSSSQRLQTSHSPLTQRRTPWPH